MKIWMNTELGNRLASSTNNPDTEAWRIVYYLRSVGRATTDQIVSGARAPSAAGHLAILARRNPPIVQEVGSHSMEGGSQW